MSTALNRARSQEREQASPLRKQPPPRQEDSELVSMLKRKLQEVNTDKEKIRNEMISMASLLDQKEAQLRTMQIKLDKVPHSSENEGVLHQQCESLKIENDTIKHRLCQAQADIERISRQKHG